MAIKIDVATLNLIKAFQQVDDGGLPGPGWPDNRHHMPSRCLQVEVFNQVSPYMILGMDTAVCLVYFTTKIGLYSFVNSVFFDTARCRRFTEAYLLCILALGVALFPPALLMVYFDLNFQTLMWVVICLIAVDKLLLLYKIWSIFFSTPIGWVHLFMYFCTLEIAPLLVLYRAMLYANNFLLTIN